MVAHPYLQSTINIKFRNLEFDGNSLTWYGIDTFVSIEEHCDRIHYGGTENTYQRPW